MRKIGIITNIENNITISIWDELTKKVITKQITNYDKEQEYKILGIVEYIKETNKITPLLDDNLTKEEREFLVNTLKEVMSNIKYQKIFLEEIDILSKSKNK